MQAAKDLLKRAVELDSAQKYREALICYEEGIQNLLRALEVVAGGEGKQEIRKKAEQYLSRAEELKVLVKANEDPSERVHILRIKDGEMGHSYSSVFQPCLDANVEWVELQDPYLRSRHQVHNLVRFCELLVKGCQKLKEIRIVTSPTEERSDTSSNIAELTESLKKRGIDTPICHSPTVHDREVKFSNGWMVKLGRGLDYFKKAEGQFSIGFHDFDLRPCHETTIEIFHRLNVKSMKH